MLPKLWIVIGLFVITPRLASAKPDPVQSTPETATEPGQDATAAEAASSENQGGASPENKGEAEASTTTHELGAPDKVEYGAGIRLRGVFIPKGEIEMFGVERAGDHGSSTFGFGLDFTRRRGRLELQLGLEFEAIKPGEGIWIDSGQDISAGAVADYMIPYDELANKFGWVTFEFTVFHHTQIANKLSLRYGGGLGLGILYGELEHYNMICAGTGATNDDPTPCHPPDRGGTGRFEEGVETRVAYNTPPVFPVVNAIVGLQYRPHEKVTVNVEGGLRTLLFFGLSSSYFF